MSCDTVHRLAVPCALQSSAAPAASPGALRRVGLRPAVLNVLAVLRAAYLRWLSVRELRCLRDQDLRDIGISRHEIEATVEVMLRQAREPRRPVNKRAGDA